MFQSGDAAGALAALDELISANETFAKAIEYKAMVLTELGRVEEAKRAATHALELQPMSMLAQMVLKQLASRP
jgi:Flp pilus assembly protein TadD